MVIKLHVFVHLCHHTIYCMDLHRKGSSTLRMLVLRRSRRVMYLLNLQGPHPLNLRMHRLMTSTYGVCSVMCGKSVWIFMCADTERSWGASCECSIQSKSGQHCPGISQLGQDTQVVECCWVWQQPWDHSAYCRWYVSELSGDCFLVWILFLVF